MVRWLDRTIQVEALVSDEPMPVTGRDTARALVGTELLANCLLLVDFVARGLELPDAVRFAKRFIHEAIKTAPGLGSRQGHGFGPVNHWAAPDDSCDASL